MISTDVYAEAEAWLGEAFSDCGNQVFSQREIARAIEANFDGGWVAFVNDWHDAGRASGQLSESRRDDLIERIIASAIPCTQQELRQCSDERLKRLYSWIEDLQDGVKYV